MTFLNRDGVFSIWNGVRYLGRLRNVNGTFYYCPPQIESTIKSDELRQIAGQLGALNRVFGASGDTPRSNSTVAP